MSLTGFEGLAAVEPADRSPLRRSTYLALSTREFAIAGGDGALDLLEVADLPLAAELPGYERRDDAFRLHFRARGEDAGPGFLPLRHPELGLISLFVSSAGSADDLEAIIDRTVWVARNAEIAGEQPLRPLDSAPPRARLSRAALRRSGRKRRLTLTVSVCGAEIEQVHAALYSPQQLLGSADARVDDGDAELTLEPQSRLASGSYRLKLIAVDREGYVSELHRPLHLT